MTRKTITAALAAIMIGTASFAAPAFAGGQVSINLAPADAEQEQAMRMGLGMYALEGILYANVDVSGTYRFSVVSVGGSGNTNIRQGGAFTAASGDEATLGRVMLGGSGAAYEATLEITTFGETVACTERVGART